MNIPNPRGSEPRKPRGLGGAAYWKGRGIKCVASWRAFTCVNGALVSSFSAGTLLLPFLCAFWRRSAGLRLAAPSSPLRLSDGLLQILQNADCLPRTLKLSQALNLEGFQPPKKYTTVQADRKAPTCARYWRGGGGGGGLEGLAVGGSGAAAAGGREAAAAAAALFTAQKGGRKWRPHGSESERGECEVGRREVRKHKTEDIRRESVCEACGDNTRIQRQGRGGVQVGCKK